MQLHTMLKFRMGWAEAEGPRHECVLSSRVRLARNLAGTPFPARAQPQALQRVLEEAFAAARATRLKGAAYFKLSDLEAVDRSFLVERHLVSPLLACAPSRRGVVVGDRETLSLMVNEEDHLRIAAVRPGLDLAAAAREADAFDDELGASLDYAFRDDWGFLTACPTNVGTAMRASCLVHLPALGLAGRINSILKSLSRAGLAARGLHGEGTKVMGDFYQVSNATGLGRTEGEIVAALESAVGALVDRERESREALLSGPQRSRLEDLVYRSVGALLHARLLSFEEACHHLSALRLGIALGWEMPSGLETVNELMILAQPAHLQMAAHKELPPAERDALRASLVRDKLRRP